MINYLNLEKALSQLGQEDWFRRLQNELPARFSTKRHGDFNRWKSAIDELPNIDNPSIDLTSATITVGSTNQLNTKQSQALSSSLQKLQPWRKGPFQIFDSFIDTEWRSDWKWQRLQDHISPLDQRNVLDIGCGSGYHLWRMLGAGAKLALGVDPSMLFTMQFAAVNRYVNADNAFVLPIGVDDVAANIHCFDTVFSMGVLYHRQSPIEHLFSLNGFLKPGGELVLETLVIDNNEGHLLFPEDRYAQMRNVWFIPSCDMLKTWLRRCGFIDIRVVDVNITSMKEQRSTQWMQFNSLADFLDGNDQSKTIEGYPAPRRAIIIAKSPIT